MKIILFFVSFILLGWGGIIAFAGVETTTQQMQFTGGPEFTVVRTTATMQFTGQ
jgi:hypothetical protein